MNSKLPDQVSINVFEQVNSICDRFRKDWKQGKQPSIEFCLEQVDQEARSNLFRNLLLIDIDSRRRAKQNPTSSEYLKRFPKFARLIRQAFYESTMMSMEEYHNTPEETRTMDLATPAANRLGDYHLLGELGRGGFGVVYRARHQQRQNVVALKTLPIGEDRRGQDNAERLHKFRREFRSLADVNHPNLVGMQTLEVDGGQWFFTMDLVDGVDFITYVRPDGKLDENRLRVVLPQLASGIMALHAGRIIHRDLKPSNLLVDFEGKVTILDFGLVVELEERTDQTMSMQSSRYAGTPIYSAPEQIMGKAVSSSDWYAMGVILYEALTGERPFQGTLVEILRQKTDQPAPSLTGLGGIPEDLAELTNRLLERQPDDRPGPLEIAKAFSIQSESVDTETMETDSRHTIDESGQILVGREKQLAELNQLKQRLLNERKPLAVFITGKSGEGKTSLAEKFLGPLRLGTEVLVLSGRCYDRESVPFKAIDSFIDSLVGYLRGRTDEQVTSVLPEDIQMLAHLFPIMGRVKAISERCKQPVSQLDSKQIRARAFNALGGLLANIGNQLPVVMFVDDLQWGDSDSADVLFGMLTSDNAPALLLVGSYRRDEAEESPFLRSWEDSCSRVETEFLEPNVVVGPLTEQQCLALMIHRFGDGEIVRRQASKLYASTGGNPYFLDQLIESFDADTGTFTPKPLNEVIDGRLSKLPPDAAPLLKAIAVSGSATSIKEACKAAGLSESAYATVTHMRTERLVRLIGAEGNQIVDTYHDKIRETVLDGLDDHQRQKLHLAYAKEIERSEGIDGHQLLQAIEQARKDIKPPPRVFDLAYHFSNAGDSTALAYSILAAEQAVSQYALPLAIDHYQAAERLMDGATDQVRYRVLYGLGTVLQLGGQYELANQQLDQAILVASDTLEEVRAKLQQADIIYKTGSLRDSITVCSQLLQQLDCPIPGTRLGKHISANKYRVLRRMQSVQKLGLPDTDKRREKTALLIDVLRQLTYPGIFRDRDIALWASSIADDLAGILKDKKTCIVTAAMRVLVEGCFTHRADRIQHYAQVSGAYADELNDRYGQAISSQAYGSSCYLIGQFQSSIPELEKAIQQFDQLGDIWRKLFCENTFAVVSSLAGEFGKVQRNLHEMFATAVKFGQYRIAMAFLGCWLKSSDRCFPLERILTTFEPVCDDLFHDAWLKSEIAAWYLKNGDIEQAIREAQAGVVTALEYCPIQGTASSVFPVYANALREQASAVKSGNQQELNQARRQSLAAAKQAVRFTRKSTMNLPYALRELALNYMVMGKFRKAFRQIEESCEIAQRQGAKYEYAQSLLVLGQVGEKLGRPEARQQIEEADAQLAKFEKQLRDATIESFGPRSQSS